MLTSTTVKIPFPFLVSNAVKKTVLETLTQMPHCNFLGCVDAVLRVGEEWDWERQRTG